MNLTDLANEYHSDKGTKHGVPPHRYTYLYDLAFAPYREREINLLEMGLAVGGPEVGGPVDRNVDSPSVQMWARYFPRARIYGFDISDFSHISMPRFIFTRGDSGSEDDIKRLANVAPHFDIIIDDASHASYHQQLAFLHLWPKLAPGGLYVIEDLHWQSPAFEDYLPEVPKTANVFNSFFADGVYVPNRLLSKDFMEEMHSEVFSFACFPTFDGQGGPPKIAILQKLP